MNKKILVGILGGLLGLLVGIIGGGFLGLVVGGTFLGGFEIHKYTGYEGYELAAYVGVVIGVLIMTPLGVKSAMRIAGRAGKV